MSYEEDEEVLVRFPLTQAQEDGDRSPRPWLPAWIARGVRPDEWEFVVEDERLAVLDEQGELWYPTCFRDSSELRGRA